MRSIAAIACLLAASWPAPSTAQSRLNLSLAPKVAQPGPVAIGQSKPFAMPVIDYVAADGRVHLRRGVVAGVDLSPRTAFGLGIFEGAPKRRLGAADPAKPDRRSRRAAVGLSVKF